MSNKIEIDNRAINNSMPDFNKIFDDFNATQNRVCFNCSYWQPKFPTLKHSEKFCSKTGNVLAGKTIHRADAERFGCTYFKGKFETHNTFEALK